MSKETITAYALFEVAGSTSQAVTELQRKIEEYLSLPTGWHYGEGVPMDPSIKESIKDLGYYAALFGLDADAFPLLSGGCSVAFYSADDRMEIIVDPSSPPIVRWEHGKGFQFTEEELLALPTLENAKSCLLKFSGRSWFSSGFFTPSNSILVKNASQAEPFAIPAQGEESQLSIWPALQHS
jgi:hypothetical protein